MSVAAASATGSIPLPPVGVWARLRAVGPGFLWMVSAAGSGELLFTPRIGALYGYSLLWAMLAAVSFKWFINREIGRFAVCTGTSLIEGIASLRHGRSWALPLILAPQLVVAVASIAGLAGSAATALATAFSGDVRLWTVAAILSSTSLVMIGRYRVIERVATLLAVALSLAAVIAAISVTPASGPIIAGMTPRIPEAVKITEILPWLGFMLSGAAGMVWYSYWVLAKGYGAARAPNEPRTARDLSRLRRWVAQMTLDNTVAVAGTLVVALAFLVLGAELLRPKGLVPEEGRIAEVLGEMLGGVWGRAGFWFMIVGVFVGFWDTVLSDQDGFGRMFANGTRMMGERWGLRGRWVSERFLQRAFVLVLTTALPIALYLVAGRPVRLLAIAGAIEAAHIPVVAGFALWLNRRKLPTELRPTRFAFAATAIAGLFFLAFAIAYLVQLMP